MWKWPLPGITTDIPYDVWPGSFGAARKYDVHTGVDLHCRPGQIVVAVEDGVVSNVVWFTGQNADSPWWNDTRAVLVQGESGVVCYGEVAENVEVGQRVKAGDEIGKVVQVLKKDKGRPTAMLHLELYTECKEPVWWRHGEEKPANLLDPTEYLKFCEPICKCGAPGVWEYVPGDSVACEECVPRGCSCQLYPREGVVEVVVDGEIINSEEDYEMATDEQGRELPCEEWFPICNRYTC